MSESDRISADRIRAIDAFADLTDDEVDQVAAVAGTGTFDEGEDLLAREEFPDGLIAIEEGEVEVRRHDEVVARLSAGTVVGERGVLKRSLRNADVVAASPVKVICFHRNKVSALRREIPDLDERLQEIAEDRES